MVLKGTPESSGWNHYRVICERFCCFQGPGRACENMQRNLLAPWIWVGKRPPGRGVMSLVRAGWPRPRFTACSDASE